MKGTPNETGGWGGIRTLETLARLPVFKTGAFNHSATHPTLRCKQFLLRPLLNWYRIGTGATPIGLLAEPRQ
jgi:hypothetical protein